MLTLISRHKERISIWGNETTADYISAQVQLSLKCIPSWGPGYLNEALRVKISWEIGKWIIECDHYIIQSRKEILKWTQTGDIFSWLIMTALLWLLILSMGLSDVVHTPVTSQCTHCVSVLFSDQSLYIWDLLNWNIFPSVLLEQFGLKNQYTVIILYLPSRLHVRKSFPVCVIQTYWLVTILTMDKIHRYHHCPSVPILFIRGCSQLHTSSIPRSHLNLKSSNILPSPPPILIDILHPPPVMDRLVSTFWHSLQSHLESVLLWEA